MNNNRWCIGIVILSIALSSCKDKADHISGTYIRTIDHEYALGNDTLFIKAINATTYQIEKRSSFQKIAKIKGKVPTLETQKRTWLATYDKDHKLLREPNQGKVIVFSEDKNLLLMGKMEYKKVVSSE